MLPLYKRAPFPQHIADLARYMRMTMVSSVPAFPVITGKSYNATKIAMKEMDIISTELFLASESMCPTMRWRSSQPDKHYKKLLASKSPDGPSNERKIVTLCKYAAKCHFRILKIAKSLEDRSYKELKLEHNKFINMVVQMACFAVNMVNVVIELLDNSKQETMRILGCQTLMTFIYSQTYGNYTHTIESLIHEVSKLARQSGGDHQGSRSSSLKCISAMVPFLAEFSYIFVDFDEIVHASLDNYEPNTHNEDDIKVTQLDGTKLSYPAKHTLIDTGSRVQRLAISGQELGISYAEALSWEELPKHVVALREGYIAVKWRKMGASVNIFSRKELPLKGLNDEIRAVVALELKTSPFTRVVLQVQLQDSLDRHAKSLMVVHVSSEEDSFSKTICTL